MGVEEGFQNAGEADGYGQDEDGNNWHVRSQALCRQQQRLALWGGNDGRMTTMCLDSPEVRFGAAAAAAPAAQIATVAYRRQIDQLADDGPFC